MNPTLRLRLLQVHRWSGLTIGLLLVYLALTGLALEFRDELHGLAEPAALKPAQCEQPLKLDDQIAAARAAHPGGKYDTVLLSGEPGAPTQVRFSDDTALFVDACSGQVLHQQARWGGLFGRLEQLHRFRFLEDNDIANLISGGAAVVLALLLAAGGVALWWPTRGTTLKSAASLRPHLRGRAFDLNLHKVAGVWGAIILVGVALTSQPLAFRSVRSAINTVVGSAQPAARPLSQPPSPEAKPLKMGQLWERAQAVLDHPGKAVLAFPRKKTQSVEIYALERGAPHSEARSYVYLDAYSGEVLRLEPYATSSLGNRIYRVAGAIHSGEYGLLLQVLEFLGTLMLPVLAFTGLRSWLRGRRRAAEQARAQALVQAGTLLVKVAAMRDEAQGIRSFELVAADGGALPAFEAGAHVDLQLAPALVRSYSLCSDPQDRSCYRIAVKLCADSRGGSRAMHEQVRAGTTLRISAPRNHFPLQADAARHLLVAGGIGITPMLAMAQQLLAEGRDFQLHYFAHSLEQAAFTGLLAQPRFEGRVHLHTGLRRDQVRLQLGLLLAQREEGQHLYLCGPAPYMELARQLAADAWPEDAVHLEHFRADVEALAAPQQAFEVQLRKSNRRLLVPAGSSIADVLGADGLAVTTSCREGVCGSCMTRVLGGECDHRDSFLSPKERQAQDRILVCVSRARGAELVLDL